MLVACAVCVCCVVAGVVAAGGVPVVAGALAGALGAPPLWLAM